MNCLWADGSGGWSVEGCTVLNWTENETVCSCNHLTNFGVLLVRRTHFAFLILTYIGCSMSCIFLTITLFMYLKLRKDIPNKILIQLCLALLFLNLVFLLDSFLAKELSNVGLCISTAFFLCYFLLASFTWMSLESLHMYLSIVKVFNNYIPHFMIKITVVGWGMYAILMVIGSIRTVVVVYFCVTYALNFTMFIVVMVLLCRIKRSNPHRERGRTSLQDVWSVTALAVLLGLTWAFGLFFVWKSVHLVSMYLFTICNSLQVYVCCRSLHLPLSSVSPRFLLFTTVTWSLSVLVFLCLFTFFCACLCLCL
uniref:Uncharacterized protein n=1 Tax=Astyanax mexicanus TaxID=7994 RepID=A0A3B1IXC9_ASTMX